MSRGFSIYPFVPLCQDKNRGWKISNSYIYNWCLLEATLQLNCSLYILIYNGVVYIQALSSEYMSPNIMIRSLAYKLMMIKNPKTNFFCEWNLAVFQTKLTMLCMAARKFKETIWLGGEEILHVERNCLLTRHLINKSYA